MNLSIDPKYFNKFAVIVGIVIAFFIVVGSIYLHHETKVDFITRAKQQNKGIYNTYFNDMFDQDSVRVAHYKGKFVALCFWSTFAEPSKAMLNHLKRLEIKYPQKLMVLAASVREDTTIIRNYLGSDHYPFRFVSGTKLFFKLKVPGLPTMIVYRPNGSLLYIQTGFRNSSALKQLRRNLAG